MSPGAAPGLRILQVGKSLSRDYPGVDIRFGCENRIFERSWFLRKGVPSTMEFWGVLFIQKVLGWT